MPLWASDFVGWARCLHTLKGVDKVPVSSFIVSLKILIIGYVRPILKICLWAPRAKCAAYSKITAEEKIFLFVMLRTKDCRMTNYKLCCLQMKEPFCGRLQSLVWPVNSNLTKNVPLTDLFFQHSNLYCTLLKLRRLY